MALHAGIFEAIEIVSVKQIERLLRKKGPSFSAQIFSSKERRYCKSKANPYEHFSARYAAKKAFAKALHLKGEKQFNSFEIRHFPGGKPYFKIPVKVLKAVRLSSKSQIELSIAHERKFAVGSVVILP